MLIHPRMLDLFIQFGLRLVTFLLNAVILRCVSKELLGVVNVRCVKWKESKFSLAGHERYEYCN